MQVFRIAAGTEGEGPELRCRDHPDWWGDAAGPLPDVIKKAKAHVREDHRVHVPWCMCRDPRVIDSRCVPGGAR